jgi:hypothetical protein
MPELPAGFDLPEQLVADLAEAVAANPPVHVLAALNGGGGGGAAPGPYAAGDGGADGSSESGDEDDDDDEGMMGALEGLARVRANWLPADDETPPVLSPRTLSPTPSELEDAAHFGGGGDGDDDGDDDDDGEEGDDGYDDEMGDELDGDDGPG